MTECSLKSSIARGGRSPLPPLAALHGRERTVAALRGALEESILTGRLPWGKAPALRGRPDFSPYSENFVAELYDFRNRLESDDNDLRRRAVYANVMVAMLDQLNEVRERHRIPDDVRWCQAAFYSPRRPCPDLAPTGACHTTPARSPVRTSGE
jgi:hypothetical protein